MPVHGTGSGRRAMAVHVLRTGGSRPQSHALPKTSKAALSQASNADCASSPRLGRAGNKTIGGGVERVLGAGRIRSWSGSGVETRSMDERGSAVWALTGVGVLRRANGCQASADNPGLHLLQGTACNGTMPGTRNTILHAEKDATVGNRALAWPMVRMPSRGPACCVWIPAERKISNQQSRGAEDEIRMAPPKSSRLFWWSETGGPEPPVLAQAFRLGKLRAQATAVWGGGFLPHTCGGGKEGTRTNMGEVR
jgi:hypothetical protein